MNLMVFLIWYFEIYTIFLEAIFEPASSGKFSGVVLHVRQTILFPANMAARMTPFSRYFNLFNQNTPILHCLKAYNVSNKILVLSFLFKYTFSSFCLCAFDVLMRFKNFLAWFENTCVCCGVLIWSKVRKIGGNSKICKWMGASSECVEKTMIL